MHDTDPHRTRWERLRQWRKLPERDLSLRFIAEQFQRTVERPYRQLTSVVELWNQLVPLDLVDHTRLDSLKRGILRVRVDSSARLYELDRLLRDGLEQELIRRHKGPALRRIELRVTNDLLGPERSP